MSFFTEPCTPLGLPQLFEKHCPNSWIPPNQWLLNYSALHPHCSFYSSGEVDQHGSVEMARVYRDLDAGEVL